MNLHLFQPQLRRDYPFTIFSYLPATKRVVEIIQRVIK